MSSMQKWEPPCCKLQDQRRSLLKKIGREGRPKESRVHHKGVKHLDGDLFQQESAWNDVKWTEWQRISWWHWISYSFCLFNILFWNPWHKRKEFACVAPKKGRNSPQKKMVTFRYIEIHSASSKTKAKQIHEWNITKPWNTFHQLVKLSTRQFKPSDMDRFKQPQARNRKIRIRLLEVILNSSLRLDKFSHVFFSFHLSKLQWQTSYFHHISTYVCHFRVTLHKKKRLFAWIWAFGFFMWSMTSTPVGEHLFENQREVSHYS